MSKENHITRKRKHLSNNGYSKKKRTKFNDGITNIYVLIQVFNMFRLFK